MSSVRLVFIKSTMGRVRGPLGLACTVARLQESERVRPQADFAQ